MGFIGLWTRLFATLGYERFGPGKPGFSEAYNWTCFRVLLVLNERALLNIVQVKYISKKISKYLGLKLLKTQPQ